MFSNFTYGTIRLWDPLAGRWTRQVLVVWVGLERRRKRKSSSFILEIKANGSHWFHQEITATVKRNSWDIPSWWLLLFRKIKELLHFTKFLAFDFLLCLYLFRVEIAEWLSLLSCTAVCCMMTRKGPKPWALPKARSWDWFIFAAESPSWQRFLVLCQTVRLHNLIACYKVISEHLKIAMHLLICFFECFRRARWCWGNTKAILHHTPACQRPGKSICVLPLLSM